MDESRPSPEEMLARARLEARPGGKGRLKVFFGAAPGVGKTYAMLESARQRARDGVEVVIGWVETHGRRETAALTDGLERLAPRALDYRGLQLQEFDLDAALARSPALLVVDELPHTNAPGSRHARRWQDIEELLAAGIDVYTTLNVQHLESLVDVIALLTGVVVQETVPDRLIETADEIELIDLPPEELLGRLREGKVYIASQAARAMENYFTPRNLTALRELVLRRMADRVGELRKGLPETAAAEVLLVVVDASPGAAHRIRAMYRMASRLRAHWIALTVESPMLNGNDKPAREAIAAHLALAQRLGAETLVVRGEQVADEVRAVARERRVGRVVVGSRGRKTLRARLFGDLASRLIENAPFEVLVIPETARGESFPAPIRRPGPVGDYLNAVLVVAAGTVLCALTRALLNTADRAMIYLLAVLVVSSIFGRGPSLLAAFLAVAALNFFFVPPFYTFAVSDSNYILTFAVMLLTAMLVSRQTLRIREQADAARERERRTVTLFQLTRSLGMAKRDSEIRDAVSRHVAPLTGCEPLLLLADSEGGLDMESATTRLSDSERAVARWVFDHGRPAGAGTDTLPSGPWTFFPVGAGDPLGVLALRHAGALPHWSPAERQLLETALGQVAAALAQIRTDRDAEQLRIAVETEKARNTLLAVVSHDLRTPLSSIAGAADALRGGETRLSSAERAELLESIGHEAARLTRLVTDLLDISRLQSRAVPLRLELYPVEELVDAALEQVAPLFEGRSLSVRQPEEMLFVNVDPSLMTRVLVNLLENAAHHTPRETRVEVVVETPRAPDRPGIPGGSLVRLRVLDDGPGIMSGEEHRIFESFIRGTGAMGVGTGLGLALCVSIVRAHGGTIQAENRPEGGAAFTVDLPRVEAPVAAAP
jgi:two-component system sensor histidine kinase KdpD